MNDETELRWCWREVGDFLKAHVPESELPVCNDGSSDWEALSAQDKYATVAMLALLHGLRSGGITAHWILKDGRRRNVPAWAWAHEKAAREYFTFAGWLHLDPFLPEEWKQCAAQRCYIEVEQFRSWLTADAGDALENLPDLPTAIDQSERPTSGTYEEPSERGHVDLTEALTWIAYRMAMDLDCFHIGTEYGFGPFESEQWVQKLAAAMTRLSDLGSDGKIAIRGRHVERYADRDNKFHALTRVMSPEEIRDYARFDTLRGGLEFGNMLRWETPLDEIFTGRPDGWIDVEVNRENLLAHFPLEQRVVIAQHATHGADPSKIHWSDFGESNFAELERLSSSASGDEWWTWPEALAWVGSRDTRTIATLRFWAVSWVANGDSDQTVILGAQESIARQHCASADQVMNDLHRAIERGDVQTIGRAERHAKSKLLEKDDWRGGTVVYSQGVAQLVSIANTAAIWALDVAVSRADLLKVFPPSEAVNESAPTVTSTAGAENDCRDWLVTEFAADPDKQRSKSDFRKAALARFRGRLSERGFNLRVWPTLAKQNGRDGPGAKKKS